MTRLNGVGVALVTPFAIDGTIDYAALGNVVDNAAANGVDFLVALGTTAETPTLTPEERDSVAAYIKQRNGGRLPLVIGIGGNCTAEVVRAIRACDMQGVDAVLSVTPYYNKPSQAGLYAHFRTLAEQTGVPVILYNVPSRTGVNLEAETTLRLAADCPNIIGLKAASGNLEQIGEVIRRRPAGFAVFSGDDATAADVIAMGGDGVISVAANVFPAVFTQMIRAARTGDASCCLRLRERLREAFALLSREGNPAGVKAALALQGKIQNILRLPLTSCSDELLADMRRAMTEAELI